MNETTIGPLSNSARRAIQLYLGISALVFVLMMVLGVTMRLSHAQWLGISPAIFYQIMTAHGAGMIGISGLAASAIMWYFLRRYVNLNAGILWANLGFFLTGVVLILGGIFLGGFAGGWTFLFPLPSNGMGLWGVKGAASFLIGLLLIGIGFLLLYLDVARAIISKYGNISRGLGWPQLFGDSTDYPPATVVASTMVLVVNIAGILAGAIVLVMMIINLFIPSFEVDALLTKNMIYFFGHVFINATIYQAVIAVYELLPVYTNRPWKVNKIFLVAWTASTIMVMAVYPHHLLMDFAMPTWTLIMGQILSYTSGFPVLVVTAFGTLIIIHRSNINWNMVSGLLFLSMFGWAVGTIPAIVDGTIAVNNVMHNTLWVPGHFHMYLIVGLVSMLFGFMYYMVNKDGSPSLIDKIAFWLYALSGTGFAVSFLFSGHASIPRRWAEHLPEWIGYGQVASIIGAGVAIGVLLFSVKILINLPRAKTA